MDYVLEGLRDALKMIISLDREMLAIVLVSLKVCALSLAAATLLGVPVGFWVGLRDFPGKRAVVAILHTLLALPTVVIGLLLYCFLSRRSLLGPLGLLYTPWAMVIGQTILAFPIVAAFSLSATQAVDKRVKKTALTLGASNWQTALLIFSEGRFAILSAIIAAFGRVFGEVGVSMMVGGNIKGSTRNITTAIAKEAGEGNFTLGLALGIILLAVALGVNVLFHHFQGKRT